MNYRRVNLEKDLDTILTFRLDTVEGIHKGSHDFKIESYRERLEKRIAEFPEWQLMVEQDGKDIGALFLSVQQELNKKIGYIHFIYLCPAVRGKGYGEELLREAERHFKEMGIGEYHLRVDLENHIAKKLYEKIGMKVLREEKNGNGDMSIRMGKGLMVGTDQLK